MANTPDEGFIKYKSRQAVSFAIVNLQRLTGVASAMHAGKPFEGRTVIVVGAGPSLEKNKAQLHRAAAKGIPILCVNSSAPSLAKIGLSPDVMVARESLDLSEDIAASTAKNVLVDIAAHPGMMAAAGDRLMFFISGYPRHFPWCQQLGVRPVFGGSSALCSAVQIAMQWGAARIVLVGVDLAINEDGAAYHHDTPRMGNRAAYEADGALHFVGGEDNDALCVESGQKAQPRVQSYSVVASHDWSKVLPVMATWADQRKWLEIEAQRHPTIEKVNATEGGGGIFGWRVDTLANVIRSAPKRKPVVIPRVAPVTEAMTAKLQETLASECDLLSEVSRQMLKGKGPSIRRFLDYEGIAFGAPLIEALSAWTTIDAPKENTPARSRYFYSAYLQAAEEARNLLPQPPEDPENADPK